MLNEIKRLNEADFFRGINSYIGFSHKIIEFDRDPKFKDQQYNKFTGSLKIGLNGIFSLVQNFYI